MSSPYRALTDLGHSWPRIHVGLSVLEKWLVGLLFLPRVFRCSEPGQCTQQFYALVRQSEPVMAPALIHVYTTALHVRTVSDKPQRLWRQQQFVQTKHEAYLHCNCSKQELAHRRHDQTSRTRPGPPRACSSAAVPAKYGCSNKSSYVLRRDIECTA